MLTNKSIGAKGKDHWKVGKKLAEGACGEVYDCNPISKQAMERNPIYRSAID